MVKIKAGTTVFTRNEFERDLASRKVTEVRPLCRVNADLTRGAIEHFLVLDNGTVVSASSVYVSA